MHSAFCILHSRSTSNVAVNCLPLKKSCAIHNWCKPIASGKIIIFSNNPEIFLSEEFSHSSVQSNYIRFAESWMNTFYKLNFYTLIKIFFFSIIDAIEVQFRKRFFCNQIFGPKSEQLCIPSVLQIQHSFSQ